MRALIYAQSTPWALTSESYRNLLEIADRHKLTAEETAEKLEALAAKIGKPLQNTQEAYTRNSVAILPVTGPIFRFANCFGAISGGTSSEMIATDFTAALEDPNVSAIILDINSPGGEVAGTNELAKMISAARGVKPVVSYVSGLAQSGGYWIASAAERVVIDDTALLGSIGVVMGGRDTSERDARNGIRNFEVVSSQSPYKRPDSTTDEGLATIKAIVDSLADVFIQAVAQNRGVDPAVVMSDFGQGSSLVGAKAVAAGMADEIGTLEGLIAELGSASSGPGKLYSFGGGAAKGKATNMNPPNPAAAAAADNKPTEDQDPTCKACGGKMSCSACSKATANAIAGERTRIAAIIGHAEASGREQLARTLAFETDMDAEAAGKILSASPKAAASANPLAAAMAASAPNPDLGPGGAASGDSEDAKAVAKQIAAFANGK